MSIFGAINVWFKLSITMFHIVIATGRKAFHQKWQHFQAKFCSQPIALHIHYVM